MEYPDWTSSPGICGIIDVQSNVTKKGSQTHTPPSECIIGRCIEVK
jgi:hypothetical protein